MGDELGDELRLSPGSTGVCSGHSSWVWLVGRRGVGVVEKVD